MPNRPWTLLEKSAEPGNHGLETATHALEFWISDAVDVLLDRRMQRDVIVRTLRMAFGVSAQQADAQPLPPYGSPVAASTAVSHANQHHQDQEPDPRSWL